MSFFKQVIEAFDHRVDGAWSQEGSDFFKQFEINGEPYELHAAKEQIDGLATLRVSFSWLNAEAGEALNLTNLNKGTLKVLGAVRTSIQAQFPDEDVYLFTAKDEPRRAEFYAKLCRYLSLELNLSQQIEEYGSGKLFVLYRPNLDLNLRDFI